MAQRDTTLTKAQRDRRAARTLDQILAVLKSADHEIETIELPDGLAIRMTRTDGGFIVSRPFFALGMPRD